MPRIVSIKFRTAGKHYDFNALDLELRPGQQVVVETDRGRALGTVVTEPVEATPQGGGDNLKSVLRIATEQDLEMGQASTEREKDAFRFCLERIQSRRMEMKLVRAEYLFDASKIIFYFTADGRVDFRDLVKDLAHHFHTRIEMRQIGVRDEAKLIGGIGVCGRALCCCSFLTNFAPVSVKMAKEQGLALNPNKISGQCGRLLCCLNYEYETYLSLKEGMPKCGRRVRVGDEEGEVTAQNVLTRKVTVRLASNRSIEAPVGELTLLSPAEVERAEAEKAQAKQSKTAESERPAGRRERPSRRTAAPEAPPESQPARKKRDRTEPAVPQAAPSAAVPGRPKRKSRGRRRPAKSPAAGDTNE